MSDQQQNTNLNVNNQHQHHENQTGPDGDIDFNEYINHFPPNHRFEHKRNSIYDLIKIYLKKGNEITDDFINNSTTSFDFIISHSDFPRIIKRILHAKQILFTIFLINNHYLLTNVDNSPFISSVIFYSICATLLFIIMLIVHFECLNPRMFPRKDSTMEEHILKRNPPIIKTKCVKCESLKCIRSFHCPHCDKCITKFNFHSDWFNLCVGSGNELLYMLTMFVVFVYLSISFMIFAYDIFYTDAISDNEWIYHWWTILFIYVYSKTFIFYKEFVGEAFKNLTIYEKDNYKRLVYLQKNYSKEFYNCFDKGYVDNFKEMWLNLFKVNERNEGHLAIGDNIPIPSDENDDEDININIGNNTPTGKGDGKGSKDNEGKVDENDFDIDCGDDYKAYKLFWELNKPFQPFTSQEGFVYKRIEKHEIINWNKIRIYNVFDWADSPFKELLVKNAVDVIAKIDKWKEEQKEKMKLYRQSQMDMQAKMDAKNK